MREQGYGAGVVGLAEEGGWERTVVPITAPAVAVDTPIVTAAGIPAWMPAEPAVAIAVPTGLAASAPGAPGMLESR